MSYILETDAYFIDVEPIPVGGSGSISTQTNETISFPFGGATISVSPGAGKPTFNLTAMYGEGSGTSETVSDFFEISEADIDISRLDIEGLVQIPVSEGVNAAVGGRFIRFNRQEEGTVIDTAVLGGDPILDFEGELTQNFYLAEAGFGLNRPVNSTGSVVAFGNLLAMVGYADVVTNKGGATFELDRGEGRDEAAVLGIGEDKLEGGVFGIDTNAGIGVFVAPNALLSARYRLFYLSAPDFKFSTGGTFLHGPEINLSLNF